MKDIDNTKQVISGELCVGSWFYSAPRITPDQDGRIVVISMKCFGPLEVYEWGIDADGDFYEKYQWIENDLYDDDYEKKISKEKFVKQIENMKSLIRDTEVSGWKDDYDKILQMIEDGKLIFDSDRIAEGYAKRPWLHKNVIERITDDCGLQPGYHFRNGLDVGCGAGLSAKALRLICDQVTGTDISDAMIRVCKKLYAGDSAYTFYTAKAEETITPEVKYDIVTAAGCINWIDEKRFLAKMAEGMQEGGLLVIYDFGITDRMSGTPEFTNWYQEAYLSKFPKPFRKENVWTQADLPEGFVMEKQVSYEMEWTFSHEDLVDFMLIQSNVNFQIEKRTLSEKAARIWMHDTLKPFFKNGDKTLVFSGYSWYIRRNG